MARRAFARRQRLVNRVEVGSLPPGKLAQKIVLLTPGQEREPIACRFVEMFAPSDAH